MKKSSKIKYTGQRTIDLWIELALRKCGRHHPKRHSTNKERSHEAQAKARAHKSAQQQDVANRRSFKAKVRAYWEGTAPVHPE